jgi:AAA15 family ATPase/GTPase
MCDEPGTRAVLARLLSIADLGITDITIESLPDEAKDKAEKLTDLILSLFELKADQVPLEPVRTAVKLLHHINGGSTPLALEQESAGTIAYFELLGPLVNTLKVGGVICVDELDSSLHSLIAIEIMRLFENRAQNPKGAQLIFNTHDTNLLSTGILRRDQIWFTEKDAKGESHLYPLTDFRPRREENLESGYLQGRYGAIPFIHSDEFVTSLADRDVQTK